MPTYVAVAQAAFIFNVNFWAGGVRLFSCLQLATHPQVNIRAN